MSRVTATLDFQGDKSCLAYIEGKSYESGTVCISLGELVNKTDMALPPGIESAVLQGHTKVVFSKFLFSFSNTHSFGLHMLAFAFTSAWKALLLSLGNPLYGIENCKLL